MHLIPSLAVCAELSTCLASLDVSPLQNPGRFEESSEKAKAEAIMQQRPCSTATSNKNKTTPLHVKLKQESSLDS